MVIKYLEFLRARFLEDPEQESFNSAEIESALALTSAQSHILGMAIRIGYFLGGSGWSEKRWSVRYPYDADAYPKITDFKKYIRDKALDTYDPSMPVDESGRQIHNFGVKSGKELEQKFEILFSSKQAALDFLDWKGKLNHPHSSIAVLFIDIDHFKVLNTRFGEPKIDETILPAAQKLLRTITQFRGEAYKEGGDEFIVLLPNHNVHEAKAFAEKLRGVFEQQSFAIAESHYKQITLSIGVALWPSHGEMYKELKQQASEAKGEAKNTRNTVRLAKLGYASNLPLHGSGLSEPAQRLAVLLNERSEVGVEGDPDLSRQVVTEALQITEETLSIAADELEEKGWVNLTITNDVGKADFTWIGPTPKLFFETDFAINDWDTTQDARALASKIITVESSKDLKTLCGELGWSPRRINPPSQFLVEKDLADKEELLGTYPYVYSDLIGTARTRRFVQEGLRG